jgi:peptide chain release factor 2
MSGAGFWDNQDAAQKLSGELKGLKATVETYSALERELEDEIGIVEMCDETADKGHIDEAVGKLPRYAQRVESIELTTLFTGPNDAKDVILAIHAGTGGVDAMDFAEMLARMYQRWCEKNGYEVALIEKQEGEEAGLKKCIFEVRGGKFPFGYLKSEIGVHRLIRLSPFDANHKRQTSFASVDVAPEADETSIEIKEGDLKIDTYAAGGPGGQHVNKTQSAVRITHLPSGIIVQCQDQRSQQLNRKYAMRALATKLQQEEERKRNTELAKLYGEKGEIAFGNQIRSYTMQPYQLVKDERTGVKTGDIQKVLDGDIDAFVEAFLRWKERKY